MTLVSAVGMALGARKAAKVVDQGANDLARWIEVPLASDGAAPNPRTTPSPPRTRSKAARGAVAALNPSTSPRTRTLPSAARGKPRALPATHATTGVHSLAPAPTHTTHAPAPTAPRNGSRREPRAAHKPPVARLNAPRCEGISAYIISAFEDGKNSIATLSTDPKRRGRQRRVGQRFGDYRVIRIAYNARRMSSAVWLADDAQVCQVLLRDDHPVRERLQRNVASRLRARQARSAKQRRAQLRRIERQRRKRARERQ